MINSLVDTTSGDLLADRRAVWAEAYFRNKEFEAAVELMEFAVSLAPDWIAGWFRLGEFYKSAGNIEKAKKAWLTTKNLDPEDRYGACVWLSLIGAVPSIQKLPAAFVEMLFDQYAENFENSLQEKLEYCAPDLLFRAIRHVQSDMFSCALDLGCGTGLMGERLRNHTEKLYGYDISAGMLEKARRKNIYDYLIKIDINEIEKEKPEIKPSTIDLVVAVDVFNYLGSLGRIIETVACFLAPDGILAFSVEDHSGKEDFILRETCRYSHSAIALKKLLKKNKFYVLSIERQTLRKDRNEPVAGLIVIARKI